MSSARCLTYFNKFQSPSSGATRYLCHPHQGDMPRNKQDEDINHRTVKFTLDFYILHLNYNDNDNDYDNGNNNQINDTNDTNNNRNIKNNNNNDGNTDDDSDDDINKCYFQVLFVWRAHSPIINKTILAQIQ